MFKIKVVNRRDGLYRLDNNVGAEYQAKIAVRVSHERAEDVNGAATSGWWNRRELEEVRVDANRARHDYFWSHDYGNAHGALIAVVW